jgi:hypothetical protein
MSIAVLQIREQPSYRREAFEAGLKRLGYTDVRDYRCGKHWPSGPDDLLVLWNLLRGRDEQYAKAWEAKGGTVLVCENGYLQRQDKTHYAISTHGHNGSGWFPILDDGKQRLERLGFELKPMREIPPDGLIVVRGQRGIGSALMASPPHWAENMVAKLRGKGYKHVQLMKHPGDKGKLEADLAMIQKAARLVIWSSAMGVRALVEGVPVDHSAPRWICAGWRLIGRESALANMACAQWHYEEIAAGEPFARMKAEGWGIFGAGNVKAPTKEATA